MTYCRNLGFEQEPNYAYLRRLFRDLYNKCCFEFDFIYDWTIQKFRAAPDNDEIMVGDEEEEKVNGARDNTSTLPESLRAHQNFGSDRPAGSGLIDDLSQEEQWAKQQEEQYQDAERRMAERAEQALRQNGHFLTFEDPQGIIQPGAAAQPDGSGKKPKSPGKKKGDKDKKEKSGGCHLF